MLAQDDRGAYVNFLGAEGEDRVRAAYPGATSAVAIKRRYDPTNLFRRNHNIPPQQADAGAGRLATRGVDDQS